MNNDEPEPSFRKMDSYRVLAPKRDTSRGALGKSKSSGRIGRLITFNGASPKGPNMLPKGYSTNTSSGIRVSKLKTSDQAIVNPRSLTSAGQDLIENLSTAMKEHPIPAAASFQSVLRQGDRFSFSKPTVEQLYQRLLCKQMINAYNAKKLEEKVVSSPAQKVSQKRVLNGQRQLRVNEDTHGRLSSIEGRSGFSKSRTIQHPKTPLDSSKVEVSDNTAKLIANKPPKSKLFEVVHSKLAAVIKMKKAMGQSKEMTTERTLSVEQIETYKKLELLLGLSTVSASMKMYYFENVKRVIDTGKVKVKEAFAMYQRYDTEGLMKGLHEMLEFLPMHRIPHGLISELYRWIVNTLQEFGEHGRCIEYLDQILIFCHNSNLVGKSAFFFGLKAHSHASLHQHKRALTSYFQMLFAALNIRDHITELKAYEGIAKQYWELGEQTAAAYFHQKYMQGIYESEISASRIQFPIMNARYVKDVLKAREKRPMNPPTSPGVSFYEGFPLEDRDSLNQMQFDKKRTVSKRLDVVREQTLLALGQKRTPEGIAYSILKLKRQKRGELTERKLGEVKVYSESKESIDPIFTSEKELENLTRLEKLGFTNNTDSIFNTHRSANRVCHNFNVSPLEPVRGKNGFNNLKGLKYVTGLKSDISIIRLLEIFNRVGLTLEKYMKAAEEYERGFGVWLRRPSQ